MRYKKKIRVLPSCNCKPVSEAQVQRALTRWLREGGGMERFDGRGWAVELKCVSGGTLREGHFESQQLESLRRVSGEWAEHENGNEGIGLVYKLPDVGLGAKPFDCVRLTGMVGVCACVYWRGKCFEGLKGVKIPKGGLRCVVGDCGRRRVAVCMVRAGRLREWYAKEQRGASMADLKKIGGWVEWLEV